MTDLHDFERRLRADLAATARGAQPGPAAAERAIDHARFGPVRTQRNFGLPP
jgi:hypothetical protein